jgi:hypothetical protein
MDEVEQLVPMANSLAIASLNSAEKILNLPDALTEDLETWDFFLTVAAVVAAERSLATRVPKDTFQVVASRILERLDEWNANGSRGFEDCQQFVGRSLKSLGDRNDDVKFGDVLGMWILWNLYGRAPTLEEAGPARPLGGFLIRSFGNWWD